MQLENNHSKYWGDKFEISIENPVKIRLLEGKRSIPELWLYLLFKVFLSLLEFTYNFLQIAKTILLFS
jgi:hypothetical protein